MCDLCIAFGILDVKEMERMVRSVEADGLRWGACESTSARHSENYDCMSY